MKVYCVGPDEAYDDLSDNDERFVWMVYWYRSDYYEGSGEAVALSNDGLLYEFDLGHCSCYGPFEDWQMQAVVKTQEEFFQESNCVLDNEPHDEVMAKVKELLQ